VQELHRCCADCVTKSLSYSGQTRCKREFTSCLIIADCLTILYNSRSSSLQVMANSGMILSNSGPFWQGLSKYHTREVTGLSLVSPIAINPFARSPYHQGRRPYQSREIHVNLLAWNFSTFFSRIRVASASCWEPQRCVSSGRIGSRRGSVVCEISLESICR